MKKCAILLSHKVNPEQEQELREKWGVGSIHLPPQDIQARFSQVPAEGEEYPVEHIQPVIDWLEETTSPGDFVWFQGEPATCVLLAKWCEKNGRVAILATTRRESVDQALPDGSVVKKSIFKHVCFRKYPY